MNKNEENKEKPPREEWYKRFRAAGRVMEPHMFWGCGCPNCRYERGEPPEGKHTERVGEHA